jgi:predicted transposase/invertase (TIGR01784 family)
MKFVDIKNDIAFRKIFGNEKKTICLISFLNAVLELEGNDRVVKVSIINPYLLPRIAGEKSSIIDVRATDVKGRQFVVEMQVADKRGFDKRVQYYTSRDYSMQIDKGEDYALLKPTYFIGILNFGFGDGKNYHSKHLIIEQETGDNLLADIHFSFIQLTKFKKKEQQLKTSIDKWTYFIKNAENLDVVPDNLNDEGLAEAYIEADKHNWEKEELIAYDNASMREGDMVQELLKAKDIGEIEGKIKGKIEGKREEQIKGIVKALKRGKLSIEEIAEDSETTVHFVMQIKKEYVDETK